MAEDTEVRDRLAVQRTHLANERTLLAYVRTAIGFLVAGGSSIHFLAGTAADAIGWLFIAAGAVLAVIGVGRFRAVRRELKASLTGP